MLYAKHVPSLNSQYHTCVQPGPVSLASPGCNTNLYLSLAGPGSELEKKTIQRYLESQMDRSFMRVAMAVVDKDLSSLVRGVTAQNWKEVVCLALL